MPFVNLTTLDGEAWAYNADRFHRYGPGYSGIGSLVEFPSHSSIAVRETPTEISALIDAERRRVAGLVVTGRMAADLGSALDGSSAQFSAVEETAALAEQKLAQVLGCKVRVGAAGVGGDLWINGPDLLAALRGWEMPEVKP